MDIQDTGKFRKNVKDQFYTIPAVAKSCVQKIIDTLPETREYLWVEPSAGAGAFLRALPSGWARVGIDVEPKSDGILEGDYLKWSPPGDKKMVVFGNPPFGRQSSLAKSFIFKSCEFADVVAFILPRSFVKPSMSRAFELHFLMISCTPVPKNSFVLNGEKYDVPCVFQIWKRCDVPRKIEGKINPQGFRYVKKDYEWDIAIRRVGGTAGRCHRNDGLYYSPHTHNFIKFTEFDDNIVDRINAHTFPTNTTGPRSLSQNEINEVLNNLKDYTLL